MIQIRYSPPNELELSGNTAELYSLTQEIIEFLASSQNNRTWKVETTANPNPYQMILPILSIRLSTAKKGMITVEESQLVLDGNKDFIRNFADNLPYDAEDPKSGINYHVHYDSLSFGDVLSESSLEIILSKNK